MAPRTLLSRGDVHGARPVMTSTSSTRVAHAPSWFDTLLFVTLMSGPPKFRERDLNASLAGTIDLVVLVHVGVWACGGLWVLARLFPGLLRRGVVPSVNPAQVIAALFIAALTLSVRESPGMPLTAFTVGQFGVMLTFVWVFTHRFGTSACLRHLFMGVIVLAVGTVGAIVFAPGLVSFEFGDRLFGGYLATTADVALIGSVLSLSNMPPLRGAVFWGVFSFFGLLLAASRTRTAYGAFLVFLVMGFVYGKRLPVRKLLPPLTAAALTIFLMDALSSTTDYVVREWESIETMSDRIPLWEHLTSVVMRESPITGLGYYAASRVVAPQYNPNLGTAHSAFFEVLVGGGILGAALFLLLCASLLWFAANLLRVAPGQPSTVAAVGLLAVALVMGVTTESALHAGPLGFAFWATTALVPELSRAAAQTRMAGWQRLHMPESRLRVGTRRRLTFTNRQAE